MSEQPMGPGWWQASDGKWYAPQPGTAAPPPPTVAATPGTAPGAGSVVLNVLWVVLSGFWLACAYVIAGLLQCIFIITIPFGIQSFKLAGFALWPFGRAVVKRQGASQSLSLIGNVLWFIFAGFWLAILHALAGLLLCATIVGIPLGLANFKLIPLALTPFGKDIVKKGQLVGVPEANYVAF